MRVHELISASLAFTDLSLTQWRINIRYNITNQEGFIHSNAILWLRRDLIQLTGKHCVKK